MFVILSKVLAVAHVSAEIQVKTSTNDPRQFDFFQLDNALKVLLISDPHAHKAAVALDVNIGSAEDPKARQGLAHFLEHMLFLGTKSYPAPGEFQDFISGHGGQHNAQTSLLHTNFYFDIDPEFLAPATERFSRFFYEPLFLPAYVEREQLAVHSEYSSKLSVSGRRERDVLSALVLQDHPLAKFYTGNNETLGKDGAQVLREDLLRFYAKNYSANLMTLVVRGPQELTQLKEIVRENFSSIKNKKVVLAEHGKELFRQGFLPAEVHITPKKERRKLTLLFPLPSERDYGDKKPLRYIGNFIGHEGAGSILSVLRSHNLATALSAGPAHEWRGGESFSIDIALTEKGIKNSALVYELVFRYINLLRKKGIAAWRYEELEKLDSTRFAYIEAANSVREVSRLATLLHKRKPENIYWSSYHWQQFDRVAIENFLSYFTKDNSLAMLVSPSFHGDRVSEFYHAPYTVVPRSKSLRFASVDSAKLKKISKAFRLPKKNVFIAKNFAISDAPIRPASDDAVDAKHLPSKIYSLHHSRGWFLNDDRSQVPKGYVKTRLRLPGVSSSVENYATVRIYSQILENSLSELSYEAALAGLSFGLYPRPQGLDLDFYGYNDGLQKLMSRVLKDIEKFNRNKRTRSILCHKYFDQAKKDLLRSIRNRKFSKLYTQAISELPPLIYSPYWHEAEVEKAFVAMDCTTFEAAVEGLFKGGQFESLMYGNFEKKHAKRYFHRLERLVKPQAEGQVAKVEVVKFASNSERYVKRLKTDSNDQVLALYVQGRSTTMAERATVMLLEQMVSPVFYRVLRTEKQLGYIVFNSNYRLREVPGILSLVQSPTHTSGQILGQIAEFFQIYKKEILAKFERDRQALLLKLAEPPKNQGQWLHFYWDGILNKDYTFDESQRLIEALKSVDRQQIEQRYKSLFEDALFHLAISGSRHLSSVATGDSALDSEGNFVEVVRGLSRPSRLQRVKNENTLKSALPEYTFD